jgi:hypothetical protein
VKSSHLAVGLLCLALAGLWYFAGGTNPLPATLAAETQPRVAAPIAHENLTVYFIHGPDVVADVKVMSLQEALDRDLAVVRETGNVNVLEIENRSSEYDLFVQSNDIVKGGKQDRVVQIDMLLPPGSGVVALPVHCVEQGRWTGRGSENSRQFSSSNKSAAGKELKYANLSGQQPAVWDNVKQNQDKVSANLGVRVNAEESPTSFQLTLESSALEAKVAAYEAALKAAGEDRDNIIGVVFVVNGQIAGAEVYASNALFRKVWPKLLNAAAVEAVADRTDAPVVSAPSAREIERYLAHGATTESAGAPIDEPAAVALQAVNRAGRRGVVINADEEVFQTEGRAPLARNTPVDVFQTEGRAVRTDAQQAEMQRLRQAVGNRAQASAAGRAVPQPATPDGNRLNSNRTENRSTLVVESRDPVRANAVIHRSYTPAAQPAPARPAAQPAPARPAQPQPAPPAPAMPRP